MESQSNFVLYSLYTVPIALFIIHGLYGNSLSSVSISQIFTENYVVTLSEGEVKVNYTVQKPRSSSISNFERSCFF